MDKSLSFYYQNCRGLRTKLHTLYMNVLMYNYDIIILTETWLTSDIFDNELIDSRYQVYRCDRNRAATGRRDGGGVLIAIRRSLGATPLVTTSIQNGPTPPPAIVDYMLIELLTSTARHIIGVTYIPPNQSHDVYLTYFNYLHEILQLNNYSNIYLAGDYNLPSIKWTPKGTYTDPVLFNVNCLSCQQLCQFMCASNLLQFNSFKNSSGNILDLFISNEQDCIISNVPSALVPPDEHHPPFYVQLPFTKYRSSIPMNTQTCYCFKNADYTIINKEITCVDWEQIFQNKNAECAVDTFYEIIYGIICKYIPSKIVKASAYPAWFNTSLIHIFNDKKRPGLDGKNLIIYQIMKLSVFYGLDLKNSQKFVTKNI